MKVRLSEIKNNFSHSNLLSDLCGEDVVIDRIAAIESCGSGDLVFIDRKDFFKHALENKPSAMIIDQKLVNDIPAGLSSSYMTSQNVKLAHALVKHKYADRDFSKEGWEGIHPSSVIHESVELPQDVQIGPYVVVGKDVRLGSGCRILANSVIEANAQLGNNCLIHSHVIIGYNCVLKNNVEVSSNTVIGSEGFGFAQDEKRKSYKIPQTGNVILEDDVFIGPGNCIDRGAYGATIIGRGTKTDNICHFAHNVKIGEDCLLASMFCIAGSTTVGNNVIASGQVGVFDHLDIPDNTVLLHRAGVTRTIKEPGMYAAMPTQPLRDYKRNMIHLGKLHEMHKRVKELEKKVEELLCQPSSSS